MERNARFEHLEDEDLIRRRDIALGAVAEIAANLLDGTNMPPSSRQELEESRELFHGEIVAYRIELAERDISE